MEGVVLVAWCHPFVIASLGQQNLAQAFVLANQQEVNVTVWDHRLLPW